MMRNVVLLTRFVAVVAAAGAVSANAAVTQYSDRAAFVAASGAATVDDFGPSAAFPITSGVLDSTTVCCAVGTIAPGTIHPGVTYSTPVGVGFFFNIDSGGDYAGGFLDTVTGPRVLTINFATPQSGFGFDTDSLMGNFAVTISDAGGQFYSQSFGAASGMTFFGFVNSTGGITSLTIAGDDPTIGFAIDNFTFGGTVPEPATWTLMIGGFAMAGLGVRRRRIGSVAA